MRKFRTLGSVQEVPGNRHSHRDKSPELFFYSKQPCTVIALVVAQSRISVIFVNNKLLDPPLFPFVTPGFDGCAVMAT